MARLLDLDDLAARSRHLAELDVEDVGHVHDQLALGSVVLVHEHLHQGLGADGAELHRPVGEALRGLVQRGVLEIAGGELFPHDGRLIRLHHLVEDAARTQHLPVARGGGVGVAGDAAQPLDRVVEPRLAAHGEVEARVAVGEDVEPRALLLRQEAGHRVEILLAKAGMTQRVLEGAAVQLLGEPGGARIGAGDGGGQDLVAGRIEHGPLPYHGLRWPDAAGGPARSARVSASFTARLAGSMTTMSVKVPPMSTPTRTPAGDGVISGGPARPAPALDGGEELGDVEVEEPGLLDVRACGRRRGRPPGPRAGSIPAS